MPLFAERTPETNMDPEDQLYQKYSRHLAQLGAGEASYFQKLVAQALAGCATDHEAPAHEVAKRAIEIADLCLEELARDYATDEFVGSDGAPSWQEIDRRRLIQKTS